MEKFVIATSFNGNESSNKIKQIIENAYKSGKDVTLLDLNNMSHDTLKKFADIGGIDCFLFSADSIMFKENIETMKGVLQSDIERNGNTKLINIYDSTDPQSIETSAKVGNMLLDDFSTSLSHFDISNDQILLEQSLKGAKNDCLKTKSMMKVRETEVFNLTKGIVDRIENEKDEYTAKHIRSVSQISDVIAQRMELTDEERDIIKVGALLHDIGKEDVSSSVLQKPSRLTDEEFLEMRSHVVFGEVELNQYDLGRFERAKSIASEHHERYDGKGYPRGLRGEEIDKLSRIVSLADATQAMFGRSYQSGRTKDELVSELEKCSGTQFDPEMVAVLIDVLEKEPESINVSYDRDGKINYEVASVDEILNTHEEKREEQMNDFLSSLRGGVNDEPIVESQTSIEKSNTQEKDYI